MNAVDLMNKLSVIYDPRQQWKVDHKLMDILLLTICAVIAGCEGWEEIEDFGNERLDWLKKYGTFDNGVPSHHTISRVIAVIDSKQFQKCFIEWMQACHEISDGEIIAIDGKTARGSYDKGKDKGAIHMVSAFSAANELVLGQIKINEKSNEITAIPELLELLEIRGGLVTIDAMGCQRDIARKIVDKGADYLLAVKGNQGKLHEAFKNHFSMDQINQWEGDSFKTTENSHGRMEIRHHIVSDVFDEFVNLAFDWKGVKTLGAILSARLDGGLLDSNSTSIRYYISSAKLTPEQLANAARSHWAIENKLHWKMDVAMNEDGCRIRKGNAAEMLTGFRHIAINMLNNTKTFKAGLKRKQKKAALSPQYLSEVLTGCGVS